MRRSAARVRRSVLATDGIPRAADDAVARIVEAGGDDLGWAVLDLARLTNGELTDDATAVIVRRAPPD